MIWAVLFWAGLVIAGFSSLVGITGGFILVPFLLFLYPQESTAIITSISLAVSFVTALSGTIAYARLKRIDYRSGLLLALPSVPGAVIGASLTTYLSRSVFEGLLGLLLIALAGYLLWRPARPLTHHNLAFPTAMTAPVYRHTVGYSYNLPLALALGVGEGFISGLLGIGGGIIFVPALTQLLRFPAHIATATSLFTLTFATLAGTGEHVVSGIFIRGYRRTLVISLGVLIGGQIGARLSPRVPARLIIRLLSIAMFGLGLKLVLGA